MLGSSPFYWQHFRKYIVVMGTLLNDIKIVRESNGKQKIINVPVSFSQKDKALNRLLSNPELKNSWRNYLPRIGFEMGSPSYNPERKDNTNTLYQLDQNGERRKMQLPAAPYDIPFTAYLWTPYYEDALQVVEQVLPFFQPEYFVNVKEVPEFGLNRDVSIALVSVTQNDMFDGEISEARIIEWQFEFTLRGWLYGPVQEKNVIKKVMTDFIFSFDPEADPLVQYKATVDPIAADKQDPHTVVEEWKDSL